jgi:DNA (cytosine-5)-methyltransferase 1
MIPSSGRLPTMTNSFPVDACEDVLLSEIISKVNVAYFPTPDNWYSIGGSEDSLQIAQSMENRGTFWFNLKYDPQLARFVKIDYEKEFEAILSQTCTGKCSFCVVNLAKHTESVLKLLDNSCLEIHNEKIRVGDAIFLSPEAYLMPSNDVRGDSKNLKYSQKKDENIHPEYYRHMNSTIKGSNLETPDPFRIAVIEEIRPQGEDIPQLLIRKLYRPENTIFSKEESSQIDQHLLYWSHEIIVIDSSFIQGKCVLRPSALLSDVASWTKNGFNRFHFKETYTNGSWKPLQESVIQRYSDSSKYPLDEGEYPTISRPLRALDVFAGCGGLSVGLEQSGISESKWAIEHWGPAADGFAYNHQNCVVIQDDCNKVLQEVMDGRSVNRQGQPLPQKGEVELIAGGPPCQGFSMMNHFTQREYSQFKNGLVVSHLSYCDYYRPKFFILENVKNFASFKKSLVLKMCMQALIRMGYQCTFGVLQAGSFGLPQTRHRCFLLAAAPDQNLPYYPEPVHTFGKVSLNVHVEEKLFNPNCRWMNSAPLRTVTVQDAIFDLPEISGGPTYRSLFYKTPALTDFQKMLRAGCGQTVKDHESRAMNAISELRMSLIPTDPGSDWRDLPNVRRRMKDGTMSEKLQYFYKVATHTTSNTALRGVCSCARGKAYKCDPPNMQQKNTTIPFALVHTGYRSNNWSGLYGRLDWHGFFSTTITFPDPMGKQGRVLHPEQPRVVSVRECARSQGFPDNFR